MTTSLSTNQFSMIPIQGQMDLRFNPAIISAFLSAASAGSLVPGQAVKQSAQTPPNAPPLVVEAAADTDNIFGFIVYNIKNPTFAKNGNLEIAAMRGNVMYMTASAAITAGAQVMIVVASKKVATATTGKRVAGTALDGAAADGDLIRVVIDLPGALAA